MSWYYRKEGAIQDSTEGPLNEDEIASLIRSRKIKPSTYLVSPEGTKGQWIQLSNLDFSLPLSRYDAKIAEERRIQEETKRREEESRLHIKAKQEQALRDAAEAESRARAQAHAKQQEERARYLASVSDHRKRFSVVVTDPGDAERQCNKMGFEGWVLEQAFAETFAHSNCCGGPEFRRQFVLIFSQPLGVRQ
jgi:hypothetical protein